LQTKENNLFNCMNKQLATIFLLTTLFVAGNNNVTAQTKFGIFAGAGKISLHKFPYSPEDFDRYSGTTSLWAGITSDMAITKNGIHLFTNAAFTRKGFKYALVNETGAMGTLKDSTYSQKLNYADVTLQLAKKFKFGSGYEDEMQNSFFVGTGPVLSIFMSGTENMETNYFGSTGGASVTSKRNLAVGNGAGTYKRMFVSWSFAAGFEFNKLRVWASAGIPVNYYYQDSKKSIQHKLKSFGINAGYTLFGNVKKEKPVKPVPYVPVAADSIKDADGDGILDINDKCPGHAGSAKYAGCPVPDSDGDGINDDDDKCPQETGLAANNGCPPVMDTVKASTADTVRFVIYFEPAKSILRSEGYAAMSEVVRLMKANPKLVVLLKGHTDYAGTQEANFKRSLERVTVCSSYLESFYIEKKRIQTASYGNSMPAADLNDPLLQWKNRRVEVLVFEKK
jgi:outer membrane protein OmpA-like peptidoglycan-associated protein